MRDVLASSMRENDMPPVTSLALRRALSHTDSCRRLDSSTGTLRGILMLSFSSKMGSHVLWPARVLALVVLTFFPLHPRVDATSASHV